MKSVINRAGVFNNNTNFVKLFIKTIQCLLEKDTFPLKSGFPSWFLFKSLSLPLCALAGSLRISVHIWTSVKLHSDNVIC